MCSYNQANASLLTSYMRPIKFGYLSLDKILKCYAGLAIRGNVTEHVSCHKVNQAYQSITNEAIT